MVSLNSASPGELQALSLAASNKLHKGECVCLSMGVCMSCVCVCVCVHVHFTWHGEDQHSWKLRIGAVENWRFYWMCVCVSTRAKICSFQMPKSCQKLFCSYCKFLRTWIIWLCGFCSACFKGFCLEVSVPDMDQNTSPCITDAHQWSRRAAVLKDC